MFLKSKLGTSILEWKCRERTEFAVTELMLALRAFHFDHDELPPDLNALTPGYLVKVPLDDYDVKPLRYDRERRIVYSVGEDLIDSGASSSDDPWKQPDPTFRTMF
jgi:hypothetical protein